MSNFEKSNDFSDYLLVVRFICHIVIFLGVLIGSTISHAQLIEVNPVSNPQGLIQNLFPGDCINPSNVNSTINGAINGLQSFGTFTKGNSEFPFQSGIILSTGSIQAITDETATESMSAGDISWSTAPDIENQIGLTQTLNATSIEFEVVSTSNVLSFNYIFASDEYQQEYPCNFSDVFLLLVKKTNSTDPYVNIATTPETEQFVATSTIRDAIDGFCGALNVDAFEGYTIGDTNFKGRTIPLTASYDVEPNTSYTVKLIIADDIDERFDSAVFIETFNGNTAVDLGPDQSACGSTVTLEANVENPDAVYAWFKDGIMIPNVAAATYQVNETGTYSVEVSFPGTVGCTLSDSVFIEVFPFLEAPPIADVFLCDDMSNDGVEPLNLLEKTQEITELLSGTPESYSISYHPSQADAENNTSAYGDIYENTISIEDVFVRIESLDGSCLQLGSFSLEINPAPVANSLLLPICNGAFRDGIVFENLSFYAPRVTNFEFGSTVSFHLTEAEAINSENEIFFSYDIPEGTPEVFARVEEMETSCPSIVNLPVDFLVGPDLTDNLYVLDLCLPVETEFATFELILDELNEMVGGPNSTILTYPFPNLEDAIFEQNPIFGSEPLQWTNRNPHFDTIYLRIIDESIGDCPGVAALELHTNLGYNLIGEQKLITKCDDSSNDGEVVFSYDEIIEDIKGRYDVSLKFYNTAEDRDDNVNPVLASGDIIVNGSKELFVNVEHNGCTYGGSVLLQASPAFGLFPATVDYCGDPNSLGETVVFTEGLIDAAVQNVPEPSVQFYLSEEDAINEENMLPGSFSVTGNSQQIYTKVINGNTGCSAIGSLTINIAETVEINDPDPMVVCTVTENGVALVDLEQIVPELSSDDLSAYTISYFETEEDAINNTNAIYRPDGYFAISRTIYVRIENPNLGCVIFSEFDLEIFEEPQIGTFDSFRSCQTTPTGSAEFIFAEMDDTVVNGQLGMITSYYENEQDALSGLNAIDKNSPYQNLSNPQVVFVRLENELRSDCFNIAAFNLEVKTAVSFNEPSDVLTCDVDENGQFTVDLSQKTLEILNNQPSNQTVSYYRSLEDAESMTNAVSNTYTNFITPEPVYVRIGNDEGCYQLTSFIINVFELPETIEGQTLTVCFGGDTDQVWDLTDVELDILDGRQYNIGFEYYETEEALEAGVNQIADPESYVSFDSMETLFVKVINRSTGCYRSVPFVLDIQIGPEINDIGSFEICENSANSVPLESIEALLMQPNTTEPIIEFYASLQNANQEINTLDTVYYYSSFSDVIYVRATNPDTGCFVVNPILIDVIPTPVANPAPDMVACDDDFDGLYPFNFAEQASIIRGSLSEDDYTVTFYASEQDAENVINELPTTYLGSNEQTIFARLQQTRTGCFVLTSFNLIVNRLPFVAIPTQFLCVNEGSLVVSAETGFANDTYLWNTGDTTNAISINETGSFWVDISSEFGCTNRVAFEVLESEAAMITSIEVTNFTDPNSITVNVSGNGEYLYQLDSGEPQLNNIFDDVAIGYRTVTVTDINGCATVSETVLVMDAPKFFTPNGDGRNDLWHIPGLDNYPGSEIRIFNRTGKLLIVLTSDSEGWNGTYNGSLMPASDYWFSADIKNGEASFSATGHFSLRR